MEPLKSCGEAAVDPILVRLQCGFIGPEDIEAKQRRHLASLIPDPASVPWRTLSEIAEIAGNRRGGGFANPNSDRVTTGTRGTKGSPRAAIYRYSCSGVR